MSTLNNNKRLLAALLLAATASLAHAYAPSAAREGMAALPALPQHTASAAHSVVSTTTSVGTASTSSALGATVTFTATVSGSKPTGTVTFFDGTTVAGTATLNSAGAASGSSNGIATLSYKWQTAGAHAVSASYKGDANNAASTSVPIRLSVAVATATLALGGTPTTAVAGQTVTLKAVATGANPTGSIVFKDGTATLGTVALASGSASLPVSFATAGVHSVSASYSGDANNSAAASAPVNEAVGPAPTSVALSSTATQVLIATPQTLRAVVTGLSPTGTVTLKDGGNTLASAPLTSGAATLPVTFTATGSHALTATYSGDRNNAASSSAVLTETVGLASSSLTLASSLAAAKVGQSVTLSARLTADNKAGSVVFKDGATALASTSVANGVATYTTVIGTVGTHSFTAAFAGNATTGSSVSTPVAVTATAVTPTVALTSSTATPSTAKSFVLSIAVTGYQPGGTVSLLDSGTQLATSPLTKGSASIGLLLVKAGAHALTVRYAGDANNLAATSAPVTVNVTAAASLSLAASPTTITVGQATTLAASLGGVTQSGAVTFLVNGAAIGTGTLSGTTATLAYTPKAAGSYTVSATFGSGTTSLSSNTVTVTATSSNSKTPQTGNGIAYHGGTVMGQGTNIYYIWYGTWAGSTTPTILDNFIKGLGGSPYFHINTSYSDNTGAAVQDTVTLMGETTDNYSQGKALTDNSIMTIVDSALTRGALPVDPNGIYLVMTSKDVDETSGFCTQYCGWHTYYMRGPTGIKFGFIGAADRCASACGAAQLTNPPNGNAAADAMASVVVHEISETVTDPYMTGWYNSGYNENGDLCAWNFGTINTANGKSYNVSLPTGQFVIQQMWLNDRGGGCKLSYP